MSTLDEYLVQKRAAFRAIQANATQDPQPMTMTARARALGRSGVREIRIRDFQVISDSPEFFAGYDLGPGSPEIMLGALSSCLIHITLTLAADREVSLNSVDVETSGQMHPLAQTKGYEHIPIWPHNITYKLHISSRESAERIAALHAEIEKLCPIYNLLKHQQEITGELVHTNPADEPEPA